MGTRFCLKGDCSKSIKDIFSIIEENLDDSELVAKQIRGSDDFEVGLMVYEKFYFRNSSYASLSILITDDKKSQHIDIIGSGGGYGIFNISWGANQDYAESTMNLLVANGYTQENPE